MGHPQDSQKRHLLLGTVSFTVCFAAWGLISAFAPRFRQQFHLSATQTAFLVAVPVLLGALARIPIGMLADRFGGRAVFTVLMFFVAVPVALVPARNQLPESARRGVPSRNGGVFICCWRRLRLPLVLHGEPGQCARRVWTRKHWPVRCGLPGAGGGCRVRVSHRLLGNVDHPFGVGFGLRDLCSKRSPDCSSQGSLGDARRTRTRTSGVGTRGTLFSDLWWIRRLLNLPSNTVA